MNRRSFLAAGATAAGGVTAGCGGLLQTRSVRTPPLVEDRPDAVYVPTHVEGMKMVDGSTAGRYRFGLSYSYPHRFWVVTGTNRKRIRIGENDSVHLMVTVRDTETGVALPTSNAGIEVRKGGETVVSKSMWPMLSQNMGMHFGDNVALDGDGTYEVGVTFGPVGARKTGDFQGAFAESRSITVPLEYSSDAVENIDFRTLDDRKGQRGAVEPMGEMATQLPPADQLPGRVIGETKSGDAAFVATVLDSTPAGVDGSGSYLAVSARTPYNRYPIPMMSLSGTIEREGETVFEGPLDATLDPDLRYHYGAVVDGIESGDALELSVGAPPQVARHEGYETAFFEFSPATLTV
ncbi:hypothetical protein BRC83_03910 [Halobacteriales archaeon QS_1_68_17]|nr:MAG: hypothetical protein BRC83_03910 [Halobacteriales archaeon QS_1_68_17]